MSKLLKLEKDLKEAQENQNKKLLRIKRLKRQLAAWQHEVPTLRRQIVARDRKIRDLEREVDELRMELWQFRMERKRSGYQDPLTAFSPGSTIPGHVKEKLWKLYLGIVNDFHPDRNKANPEFLKRVNSLMQELKPYIPRK